MPDSDPHVDVAGYVLGALTPAEIASFETHLAGCEACQREVAQLRTLPDLLDGVGPDVELPADLRARTLAAVASAAPSPVRAPSGRAARRGAFNRPLLTALAAAAAVVIVAVAALNSGGDNSATRQFALGSSGTVEVEKTPSGWRIELDVDLPRRDDGEYYEGFVESAAGRVSVGTFNDGDNVVLWSGVPLVQYRSFVIVKQPGGAVAARTEFDL